MAVMGLGKSGLATLAALKAASAHIYAWDDNAQSRAQAEAAGYALTDLTKVDWKKIDSLVLSPGIPHTLPAPHPVAALAKQHGVEIIGDIELLFRSQPKAKMIGITGSNGKSTTTALIAHILKEAGRPVQVGGNLGIPVLGFDALDASGFYVIEMSSYQCELTPSAAFDGAVWLNISRDHIDRHGDMDGYVNAKKLMLRKALKPQTLAIGVEDECSQRVANELEKAGHWKVVRLQPDKLYDYSEAKALPGAHNAQNVAAATATCLALGLNIETIRAGVISYPGLAHRQQLIRTLNNVRFINDSKATNADAAAKALGCYKNIYWIAGGKPKEGGLNGLEDFMPRIAHAYLIGAASDEFAQWLNGKAPATLCGALEKAVNQAARDAFESHTSDAVVLLSPACASFDQFKSFEHRGDEFARIVNAL